MLGLLLDQVTKQAQGAAQNQVAQLAQALATQRQQLQVVQFQRQAEAAAALGTLDPDVADLVDHFNIEEVLSRRLNNALKNRADTFEDDVLTLWDTLERSKNPTVTLSDEIDKLTNGTFVTQSKTHNKVVEFCEKYELDHMATRNLIEALAVRERDHETSVKRDLDKLAVHMEHSNAPSKLISMKLKEIRAGCNIGAVWHCCGDSRKRCREKVKEPPPDGGP